MGCHTWFYKPTNITFDELREAILKQMKISLEFYGSEEYYDEFQIKNIPRIIRWIEEKKIVRALYKIAYFLDDLAVYSEEKDKIFISPDNMPHDLFRVSNYPEDKLYSLEETLDFIKKHNIETVYMDELVEFWKNYPDGMIRFG